MNEYWWQNGMNKLNLDNMTEVELDELIKAATEKRKTAKYRRVIDYAKQMRNVIRDTNEELNTMDNMPDVYFTLCNGTQVGLYDIVTLTVDAPDGTTIYETDFSREE